MKTVGELREALARYDDDQPLRVREDWRTIGAFTVIEMFGRVVISPTYVRPPKPSFRGRKLVMRDR